MLEQENHWSIKAHMRSCRGTDLVSISLSSCLSTKKPLIKLEKLENISASLLDAQGAFSRYHWPL